MKRYTKLPFALTTLKRKKLFLPKPTSWEDRNDQEFVELYRQHVSAKSVYALCCTMGAERYHHWRVFAEAANSVCLEMKRAPLEATLNAIPNLTSRAVEYLKMKELENSAELRVDDLPFIKRLGYRDEREWRILITSHHATADLFEVPFDLGCLHRIILSPLMADDEAADAKRAIRLLLGRQAAVTRSRLTNSTRWKRLGKELTR